MRERRLDIKSEERLSRVKEILCDKLSTKRKVVCLVWRRTCSRGFLKPSGL